VLFRSKPPASANGLICYNQVAGPFAPARPNREPQQLPGFLLDNFSTYFLLGFIL
jgi:hypothetical protein